MTRVIRFSTRVLIFSGSVAQCSESLELSQGGGGGGRQQLSINLLAGVSGSEWGANEGHIRGWSRMDPGTP